MIDDCGIYLLDDIEKMSPLLIALLLLGLLFVNCWLIGEMINRIIIKRRKIEEKDDQSMNLPEIP